MNQNPKLAYAVIQNERRSNVEPQCTSISCHHSVAFQTRPSHMKTKYLNPLGKVYYLVANIELDNHTSEENIT
jgi:hypothetical protein